jgi:hypothetical protein
VGQLANSTANPPKADNPHTLASEFHQRRIPEAEITEALPFAFPHQEVVSFGSMDQRQEKGDDVLSHAVGSILRHVRDRNAFSAGALHVNHVVPGGQDGNEPQRRKRRQDRPVERGFIRKDNF